MSLKNWSVTPASNNSAPPAGAPETTTLLKDINDIMRAMMADVRTLAAADTIASATTCDLGSKDSTFLTVSGTTTITGLGTVSAGIYKYVTFSGALTLTHNATSLILFGANITTVAGDSGLFLSLGSGNWRCLAYQPVGGYLRPTTTAVIAPTLLNSWVNNGSGTTNAGYWKDADGIVHLQGTIKSGTIGAIAFTMPSGYYPNSSASMSFPANSNGAFGHVVISSSGDVYPMSGSALQFSLDGITFRAA